MKVLLATNTDLDWGGISLFILQWLRGIKEVDENIGVYLYFAGSIENHEVRDEFIKIGAHVYSGNIRTNTSFKNTETRRKIKNHIRILLRKNRFDFIHVNSRFFAFNVLILEEAKRYGVPIRIAHFHGSLGEKVADKVVHSFFRYRIRKMATMYAGCSKMGAKYLFGEKGVNSSKWRFVPNTISTKRFAFDEQQRLLLRESIGIGDDEILLGAVGRLAKEKNHSFLIKLIRELDQTGIAAKLIILGEGGERDYLEKLCGELRVADKVILYGLTDNVAGWLSAMDCYLMPSFSEGFPISVVEAQANGLVCLLSDRITNEVDLSRKVHFLSIENGSKDWIDILKNVKHTDKNERKRGLDAVRAAGFDESDTCRYVKELYGLR